MGIAIIVIGGTAGWLTTLHINTMHNAQTLAIIANEQKGYAESLYSIKQDISEIKGELKRIKR